MNIYAHSYQLAVSDEMVKLVKCQDWLQHTSQMNYFYQLFCDQQIIFSAYFYTSVFNVTIRFTQVTTIVCNNVSKN